MYLTTRVKKDTSFHFQTKHYYTRLKIILFYFNGLSKPMARFQDGPWFDPIELYSLGGPPLLNNAI